MTDALTAEQTANRLQAAIDDYRSANARCAYYGLRALALNVRKHSPIEATTVVLDWSDQGDHMCVASVDNAHGIEVGDPNDGDIDWDEEGWASNLAGNNEDTWSAFLLPGPGYKFDIDAVLAATAQPWEG